VIAALDQQILLASGMGPRQPQAAITASVPELEKRTSSAAGTMLAIRSATISSRSVERAKTPPTSMPRRAAASTRSSA
jgi:hypothetical protein